MYNYGFNQKSHKACDAESTPFQQGAFGWSGTVMLWALQSHFHDMWPFPHHQCTCTKLLNNLGVWFQQSGWIQWTAGTYLSPRSSAYLEKGKGYTPCSRPISQVRCASSFSAVVRSAQINIKGSASVDELQRGGHVGCFPVYNSLGFASS